MEDPQLLKLELTQNQRRRLVKALRDLMYTIIDVAAETGIPFEGGGRLLVMSLTMETISHLASIINESLNEYAKKLAEALGLEPSP